MCKLHTILHLIYLHVITRIDKMILYVITSYQKQNFQFFFSFFFSRVLRVITSFNLKLHA